MRDPLDELKNLSSNLDARPLPPAEVRRRGNRMRRRRTAFQSVGAAAAVAVIASGGAFVTGNLTSAEHPVGPAARASTSPTPTPTEQAPEGGWLTTPPQGFPLDALLPDAPRESGDAGLFACSDATALPALDTAVYSEGLWVPGPRQQDRQLYLFASGTEARTAYDAVREAWRGCPPSALGAGAEFRFEVTDGKPDRFWVFREAFDASGEPAPQLGPAAIYEVRLYGNALFGASIWEPTGESPLITGPGRDFDRAMTQIDAASCVFLSDGCGDDDTGPFLDSSGYGEIRLGMSEDEVRATGMVNLPAARRGAACTAGTLRGGGTVYVSEKLGVAAIFLGGDMATDRGIRLGSGEDEVLAAYPDGVEDVHGYWTVQAGEDRVWQFAMPSGTVEEALIAYRGQDCYG